MLLLIIIDKGVLEESLPKLSENLIREIFPDNISLRIKFSKTLKNFCNSSLQKVIHHIFIGLYQRGKFKFIENNLLFL